MANATQGMYTPLPQSISDSDSEKELQNDNISTKSVNGVHKGFERSVNGYIIQSHTMDNTKLKYGFSSMSVTRKYCFLFSLVVCFLIIAIFLWVLPCSEKDTCPMHISNWENQHEDLEFKGRINVVKSAFANSHNVALLFKKSLNDGNSKNGATCILGSNGGIAWYIPQVNEPIDLSCYLIDVNGDGVKDCLLLGDMGLEAVDPISGDILYHVHNQNTDTKVINDFDMPVVIPDLNKDGINEMITIVKGKGYHNKLLMVCGRTGVLLSKVILRHCLEAHVLKYENKKVLYSCKNATTTKYYEVTNVDIENRYYNKSFDVTSLAVNFTDRVDGEYKLGGHKLLVNNTGVCPDCQSTIILLDNKNNQLWSLSHVNSYTMKPALFAFKSTKPSMLSLRGHINGYVLKLWQWSTYRMWEKDIDKRYFFSIVDTTTHTNIINERIVLITFNDTNVHVINASLIEITQLCFPTDGEYKCQPDLANQEESLLITDLDNDRYQELISYSTTFKLKDGAWKLVSSMKVIRIEAELPKLYEVTPSKLNEVLL